MLYLNKQNTQFIIALNSYLTAVLLIPKHLKFHSSYFRVTLIQVRQTIHIYIYMYIYIYIRYMDLTGDRIG